MAGEKVSIINWSENGGELIWELITELENFKVFLGKKDKHDVRSLDSISFEPKLIYGAMLPQLSLNH